MDWSVTILPAELQSIKKLKENEIIQDPNQLTSVTRLPADPFMFIGKIWNKQNQFFSDESNLVFLLQLINYVVN